jgi:hypothetical protein
MRAWVVQWESAGGHAVVKEPLIAVLPPRTPIREVGKFIERVYAGAVYKPSELITWTAHPEKNPYRVQYPRTLPSPNGPGGHAPWLVEVVCGHNPYISATYVQNLRTVSNSDGTERLAWDPVPLPEWARR